MPYLQVTWWEKCIDTRKKSRSQSQKKGEGPGQVEGKDRQKASTTAVGAINPQPQSWGTLFSGDGLDYARLERSFSRFYIDRPITTGSPIEQQFWLWLELPEFVSPRNMHCLFSADGTTYIMRWIARSIYMDGEGSTFTSVSTTHRNQFVRL